MTEFRIIPSSRTDEYEWAVERERGTDDPDYLAPWIMVGLFETHERAQAFIDRGGEPLLVEPPPQVVVNQMDLFGGLLS